MLDHFKKVSGIAALEQEPKLKLYLLLANSREQKTITYAPRLPEFIYIQQSNSMPSGSFQTTQNYMFATSAFKQGGELYTPGPNIIKEALEIISQRIDDPRYAKKSCNIEIGISPDETVEKRGLYWLTRKGSNFFIYLDMEMIFGEDYKINPEKYNERDLIEPLYQRAQKYNVAPNPRLTEELKKAYDLMGFSMMAAEVEKKAQKPRRYCLLV